MSLQRKARRPRHGESGSALIEFTLCCGLFLVPLFLGLLFVGQNLLRGMQVTQVCRDTAHMFASGTDFTQPSFQNLAVSLAPALGMTTSASTSHGVLIFSEIAYIDATCGGTYSGPSPPCSNYGYYVVVRRIVVGNTGLQVSSFGTPTSGLINASTGGVTQNGYLNDSSTRASAAGASFAAPIVLPSTQDAYIAELYVTSPTATTWSLVGPPSISARFIF